MSGRFRLGGHSSGLIFPSAAHDGLRFRREDFPTLFPAYDAHRKWMPGPSGGMQLIRRGTSAAHECRAPITDWGGK
ncbi:hypothetical protein DBT47_09735 [Aerococcus mictus]|nr:hypothetical protein DBT47_09735 [Aerococcus mictus]